MISNPYANPPNAAYQTTAPSAGQPTSTTTPGTNSQQTQPTEEPNQPEPEYEHSVKITLTDDFGKIRLGGSYTNDDNDECIALDPTMKNGEPKPWHYNSKIIREPCVNFNETQPLYEADHQAWIHKPNQGTICTKHRTKNMINKQFRYCLSSNYQQGGKREHSV